MLGNDRKGERGENRFPFAGQMLPIQLQNLSLQLRQNLREETIKIAEDRFLYKKEGRRVLAYLPNISIVTLSSLQTKISERKKNN